MDGGFLMNRPGVSMEVNGGCVDSDKCGVDVNDGLVGCTVTMGWQ